MIVEKSPLCELVLVKTIVFPDSEHFSFYLQRNKAGSNPAMEYLAFQNCMGFLSGCQVIMSTFISGRHGSISQRCFHVFANVKHYFDLWHLKKSKWGA